MKKKSQSWYSIFQSYESEINRLEGRLLELEQKMDLLVQVERNHLVRVKNKEEISDEFLLSGRRYLDLSPDKAWRLYQKKDFDFILLDVTSKDFNPPKRIDGAVHIPWEDFRERFIELQNKTTPILVICEDGSNSVLACEFLIKRGFFNCNNVSGGYKFWKGLRLFESKERSA